MISNAQQVDHELDQADARSIMTGIVREWSPTRPARLPISRKEGRKLRDADVVLIEERCKGCSYCIEFCPTKVFEQGTKLNKIGVHPPRIKDSSLCVGCGVCQEICPDFAIFLVDKEAPLKEKN